MSPEHEFRTERRGFFRTIGLGAAIAATAAVPMSRQVKADTETRNERRAARYKADSPHIQMFYRVNRYPTK